MTTPAANIQQAIDYCAGNIGLLTFNGAVSIDARMGTWISTLFGASAGIFPLPADNSEQSPNERTVTNWHVWNDIARAQIEAVGAGGCGLIGCSAVIDAVTRTLFAVRDAAAASRITVAQRNAVVTAFNTNWT